MKTKIFNIILACQLCCGFAATLTACSDDKVTGDPAKDWAGTTQRFVPTDEKGFSTYYTPAIGRIGDPMPFYDQKAGDFKVLYLQEYDNNMDKRFHPIWGVQTTDGCNYTSLGEIIPFGDNDYQQDAAIGTGWYFVPALILIILALFYMNRAFQFKYVYEEISKSKERELKHVSQFRFLERFGLVGEYIKIELKSNLRNKTMRSRCIMSLSLIIVFSLLVAYTPMYDNELMQNFWCVYCFAIYGVTALIKIMGQEGNYIDLLMTHKENIIALLKAKFWFYSMVLIIPFLIMLPAVFTGKFTLLMLFAYMLLTAGFLHFIIFQLAVYNKQTLPLQQKVTAKGNFENGMQIVIEMAALFGPILITGVGYLLVGLTYTYIFICVFGMAFIVAHPLWIRNIYNRMMKRRYENLEGFHSTRQ